MEYLCNGITLEVPQGCFPLSTDSMVLSHFVRLPRDASVLDLGSGCGVLGTLLCARDPRCHVTGIELDPHAHAAALENIARNGLDRRMNSICGDLRSVSAEITAGSFSVCVSNPPYFSGGAPSKAYPLARQESSCSPGELFRAASHCLKFGGDFFLVHKPERLAQLIAAAADHNLECKRLGLLRHSPDSPVNLILLAFRKGARPGLLWEELILHQPDGSPTPLYHEIYHI